VAWLLGVDCVITVGPHQRNLVPLISSAMSWLFRTSPCTSMSALKRGFGRVTQGFAEVDPSLEYVDTSFKNLVAATEQGHSKTKSMTWNL